MSARTIVITGIGAITRDEVLDAAHVKPGTPLLQIDTDASPTGWRPSAGWPARSVQRDYPSALRITVVERIPVVVKDFPDGPHLFDRDGVDFATAPPPPALPYLDVDNPGPTDLATKAALAVLTALRPEVAAQVSRIAAPSVASITLTLADGRTVIWGTNDRTEEKAEKLAALLTQPGADLRRVQPGSADRQISAARERFPGAAGRRGVADAGNSAKFARGFSARLHRSRTLTAIPFCLRETT